MDKKTKINQALDKLQSIPPVELGQIPNIDLYVDQVTTFLEDSLSMYKRNEDDKIMTKTMINNYTKDGVLPPSEKKKYTRHHMLLLIMIYHLKQGISINDIISLYNQVNTDNSTNIYSFFNNILEYEKQNVPCSIEEKQKKIEELNPDSDADTNLLLLILSLIIDSNMKRHLALSLIDLL